MTRWICSVGGCCLSQSRQHAYAKHLGYVHPSYWARPLHGDFKRRHGTSVLFSVLFRLRLSCVVRVLDRGGAIVGRA